MINRIVAVFIICVFSIFALTDSVKAAQEGIPSKGLILGVPFISWNEASQMEYEQKNIVNPALHATSGMILDYWGVRGRNANWESQNGKSIEELKPFIAQGIPVFIAPMPLTPFAHPIYFVFEQIAVSKKELEEPAQGLCSWMSGRKMASLNWFQLYRKSVGGDSQPLKEVVYYAARIMVGYDDDRKVVIMHDPTFGPAWEVDYTTFDQMWQHVDRSYSFARPAHWEEILEKKDKGKPYRDRNANERAAMHLLYGCGLSAAGRLAEAEEQLTKGSSIQGISKGYKHILLFELARHQAARDAIEEAIDTVKTAIDALPKNFYPWEYLADLYRMRGTGKKEAKAAKRADKKAKKLKKKNSATKAVIRTLPSDFWIQNLSNLRGWGVTNQ